MLKYRPSFVESMVRGLMFVVLIALATSASALDIVWICTGVAGPVALDMYLSARRRNVIVTPEGITVQSIFGTRTYPAAEIQEVYNSRGGILGNVMIRLASGRSTALFAVPSDQVDAINTLLRKRGKTV